MAKANAYIDGGVLLNLSLLDRAKEIMTALSGRCGIAPEMMKTVYELGDEAEPRIVAIRSLVEEGVIEVGDLIIPACQQLVFDLTCQGVRGILAQLAALATLGEAKLVTDDPRSSQVLQTVLPNLPLLTSSAILHEWQRTQNISPKEMREVLHQVEERALFIPLPHDPFFEWWKHHTSD